MANLFNILEREGSPEQIGSALRPLIRRNNEAGSDIKKSLHELETIINYAQSLGVKAKIIISPGLIFQSEHFRFVWFLINQELGVEMRAIKLKSSEMEKV